MTRPQGLPDWIPPLARGARHVPAGVRWDAVQLDSSTAIAVLDRLGERTGPVIEDQAQQVVRWLVMPRVAAGWKLPGVHVLGHGHYVAIPPVEWLRGPLAGGPPLRWLIRPVGSCLSDPVALYGALAATVVTPARVEILVRPEQAASLATFQAGVTIVTGREGPAELTPAPVRCTYCHHHIVVNADHAANCPWRPGKAVAHVPE